MIFDQTKVYVLTSWELARMAHVDPLIQARCLRGSISMASIAV